MRGAQKGGGAIDTALACLFAILGLLEIWVPFDSRIGDGSTIVSSIGVIWFAVHLSQRRSHPWFAMAGVLVWPLLMLITRTGPSHLLFFGQMVPMLALLYSVARHGQGRYRWVGVLVIAVLVATVDVFIPSLHSPSELVYHWGLFVLVVLVGHGMRVSADRAAAEAVRAHIAETTARQREIAAIVDERARIARELHDIVAHSIGVIAVQAGAAEQVVEEDPAFAREALTTIRTTSSGALGEMRRLVGKLRDSDHLTHDVARRPGIDALADLVQAARSVGLEVDLRINGEPETLPAGLDLTAYRVVQEALTNVHRHSAATRASVAVDFGESTLDIEIRDTGPARESSHPPGLGLIGMRERVALFGGRLETEAGRHGFTVRAVLPLEGV
ncbi:sensor histidine kinase [Kribbia dieselivorans]|uniref:sensor histidine kinase n=1 Tax=Kribbia dieselivorans TaxID=331526 RepID=UPI000837F0A7|nr:sensor histidine kinase [Kribbia dieselivorans]